MRTGVLMRTCHPHLTPIETTLTLLEGLNYMSCLRGSLMHLPQEIIAEFSRLNYDTAVKLLEIQISVECQ